MMIYILMIVYIKEFINGRELLRDRKEDGFFFRHFTQEAWCRTDQDRKSTYKPFWSSFIKYVPAGKFNYWLGFPDTHTHIFAHKFIHSKLLFFYRCFFLFCFQFSCKFLYLPIVPWSHFGGLQPITQIIFCTSTTTSRSSWGCGANLNFFSFVIQGFFVCFSNFFFQWCQILCSIRISRSNFWGLVVQFVTYFFFNS